MLNRLKRGQSLRRALRIHSLANSHTIRKRHFAKLTARVHYRRGNRNISSRVPQLATYRNASKYLAIQAEGSPLKSPHS